MFSFLLSHVTHPSASPSSDVLLLEQNTLRCVVDTAWSPDNQHRAVLGYGGIASKGRVSTCLVSSTCTMDILLNSSRMYILTLPFYPHSKSHGSSLLANKPRHLFIIRIFSGRLMDTPLRCSSPQHLLQTPLPQG